MKLPRLNNLRKLCILECKSWESVAVTNLLLTLPSLISLDKGSNFSMEIVFRKALSNYHNLQFLHLHDNWSKTVTLEANMFPPHLVKLTLRYSQNPMPELDKLKSLKKLCFIGSCFYKSPIIYSAGFPVLQCLKINY